MLHWIAALFGLEPIMDHPPPVSTRPKAGFESSLDNKNWPEGPQVRKEIRSREPDGWVHSNWVWRSNGYIDRPGSLHPKADKAESRHCLGVLKCKTCETIVRPNTKTAGMNAQLACNCPECGSKLLWITCEARTYHFAMEENGVQYSIWEHTGSHQSHPHPPAGRRPPRSVPLPRVVRARRNPQPVHKEAIKSQEHSRISIQSDAADETNSKKSKSMKATRKVTFQQSPPSSPKPAPTPSASPPQPHPDIEEKQILLPRKVHCEGCGESSDWCGALEDTMQCKECRKWAHTECMQSPIELAFRNDDQTWTCPSCRDIVVWADTKYVQPSPEDDFGAKVIYVPVLGNMPCFRQLQRASATPQKLSREINGVQI